MDESVVVDPDGHPLEHFQRIFVRSQLRRDVAPEGGAHARELLAPFLWRQRGVVLHLGPKSPANGSRDMAPAGCCARRSVKSGPEGPIERFDEAQRRQGHALRVGRKGVLARSLDCQIGSAIWLHSLTPKTPFRHHHGLVCREFRPLPQLNPEVGARVAAAVPAFDESLQLRVACRQADFEIQELVATLAALVGEAATFDPQHLP